MMKAWNMLRKISKLRWEVMEEVVEKAGVFLWMGNQL
jgi:hypothetical protein